MDKFHVGEKIRLIPWSAKMFPKNKDDYAVVVRIQSSGKLCIRWNDQSPVIEGWSPGHFERIDEANAAEKSARASQIGGIDHG